MNRLSINSLFLMALLLGAGCREKTVGGAREIERRRVEDGSTYVAKGFEALAQQDARAALALFTTACVKCETNFEARLQLALVKKSLGDFDGAREAIAEGSTCSSCARACRNSSARSAAAFTSGR